MSNDQDQGTTKASYLNVPHADTYLTSTEDKSLDIVRQGQIELVQNEVKKITKQNPTVEFNLTEPLDIELYKELVSQGYAVTHQSTYSSINGAEKSSHRVRVDLPQHQHRHRQRQYAYYPFYYLY